MFGMGVKEKERIILYFFIKALIVYLLWFLLYENWLLKVGWIDEIVINNLVYFSMLILNAVGYDVFAYGHSLGIDGSHGVFIGSPCNGLDLMALFAGFVIIFKGNWKTKLWFIPLGLLVIHLLNIFRIVVLTIMAKTAPEVLDFNHKYTFTLLLYTIVFSGWVIWVKKYASTK